MKRSNRGAIVAVSMLAVAAVAVGGTGMATADDDPAAAKRCVIAAKSMDAAFGRLSVELRGGPGEVGAESLLRETRVALADARDACRPIVEMTADLQSLEQELDSIESSLPR